MSGLRNLRELILVYAAACHRESRHQLPLHRAGQTLPLLRGITDEIVSTRRISSYFIPIARPKKKGKQLVLDTEWTQDRIEENHFVNRVRERVKQWRIGGYIGVTSTTRQLLEYWTNPDRERKLFFCQIEALETSIYATEVVGKYGDAWIENDLREANDSSNPGLPRMAFKMATGSGQDRRHGYADCLAGAQ